MHTIVHKELVISLSCCQELNNARSLGIPGSPRRVVGIDNMRKNDTINGFEGINNGLGIIIGKWVYTI
jgi:hypothetical protein